MDFIYKALAVFITIIVLTSPIWIFLILGSLYVKWERSLETSGTLGYKNAKRKKQKKEERKELISKTLDKITPEKESELKDYM